MSDEQKEKGTPQFQQTSVTGEPLPWTRLCDSDSLRFRAACNQSIDERLRPLKTSVIRRLAHTDLARGIYERAWKQTAHPDKPSDDLREDFFQAVSRDPSWQTLVSEEVKGRGTLSGLIDKITKNPSGLSSVVAKVWDFVHPHDKQAASALLALVSLLGVKYYFPKTINDLDLRLHAAIVGDTQANVKLVPKVDNSVTVSLTPDPNPVKIPVLFQNVGDAVKMSIQDVSTDPGKQNLGTALSNINQTLALIAACVPKSTPPSGGTFASAEELRKLEEKIESLTGSIAEFKVNLTNTATWSSKFAVALADEQPTVTLTALEGSPAPVVLQWFDNKTGLLETCNLNVNVGKIGKEVSIESVSSKCSPSLQSEDTGGYSLGQGKTHIFTQLPWQFTVDAIERHYVFQKSSAVLRFTPAAVLYNPQSIAAIATKQ